MVQFISVPEEDSQPAIDKLDQCLAGKQQVFVLAYMEGCGPCNATRPEWSKLKNVLRHHGSLNVVVADVNKDAVPKLKNFQHELVSFPTMLRFQEGMAPLAYEDAEDIGEKDRTVDSFVRWIKSASRQNHRRGGRSQKGYKTNQKGCGMKTRKTRRTRRRSVRHRRRTRQRS